MRRLRALLLLLAMAVSPSLFAQDFSLCNTNSVTGAWCEDEPKAYAAARAAVQSLLQEGQQICGPYKLGPLWAAGIDFWRVRFQIKQGTQSCDEPGGILTRDRDWPDSGSCQGGFGIDPLNPTQCLSEQKCKDRPPLKDVFTLGFGGSGTTCSNGCQYAPPVSTCSIVNGQKVCSVAAAKGTGQACAAGEPPPTPEKPQECIPAGGGLTFCLKPDGRHCYTASNGRQNCWQPGETGEKDDRQVKQKRDPGNDPKTPDPPANGDTLIPSGPPVQTQTQVKDSSGVRDINTVVQNYNTGSGANAGSGNDGENDDGSGGEDEGDDEGPGGVGEGVGELYEGKGRTAGDVFGEFRTRVQGAPIANAGSQFLTVSVGGSCPVWSVPATEWYDTLIFDFHCSGALADALVMCGYLLLAVAAYQAFKWGFL